MKKNMKRVLALALLVCLAEVLASSAKATTITAGSTGSADVFTTSFGGTTTVGDTGVNPWSALTFSGVDRTVVLSDPANVFCAGCLDFVFAVSNNSTSADSIQRISDTSFAGYSTDVGYTTGIATGCATNAIPDTVDRSLNAQVVGFNYIQPHGVGQGQCTVALEIETNATAFGHGSLQVIDGSVASVDSFAPVPEPGTLVLFGSGLISLAGLVGRKIVRA